MTALIWGLSVFNLVLALVLGCAVWRLRRRLLAVQSARADRGDVADPAPALLAMAREATPLLAIRILNPVELALQKHWAAGALGRITPGLLRQVVAREAARIASQELARHGAQAEVRVIDGS